MPDTLTNPALATGTLQSQSADHIVMAVPDTSYQLQLSVYQPLTTPIGKRITGTLRAECRRIDVVGSGGRYVEPVYGRTRRIQGTVTSVDPGNQTITINAGVPFVIKPTDPRQRADQFKVGDLVATDLIGLASFTVA